MSAERHTRKTTFIAAWLPGLVALWIGFAQAEGVEEKSTLIEAPALTPSSASGELPFPVGEKLKFNITCLMAKVGKMDLTFCGRTQHEGQEVFKVLSSSQSPVLNDDEEILATPEHWLPMFIKRDILKGGTRSKLYERYDQKAHKIFIGQQGQEPNETIQKDEQIQNSILLDYLYRTVPLKEGQEFQVHLPRASFTVRVGKEETVTVPSGQYKARALVSTPSKFSVWISCGDDPLPIKMKLESKLLNYTFELVSREIPQIKTAQSEQPKPNGVPQ